MTLAAMAAAGAVAVGCGRTPASDGGQFGPNAAPGSAAFSAAQSAHRDVELTSQALYEQAERIQDVISTPGGITLAQGVLIEDDGPAFGLFDPAAEPGSALPRSATQPTDTPYWEPPSAGAWARKTLMIESLSARSAELVFFAACRPASPVGAPTPLTVQVNGQRLTVAPLEAHKDAPARGDAPRWWSVSVNPAWLKVGPNEVIFRADSPEESWLLLIAPESHYARGSTTRRPPGRSARSTDGGVHWSGKLGRTAAASGEYAVRLALLQHVLTGQWIGPVVDLAGGRGELIRRRLIGLNRVTGRIEQATPDGTRVAWQVRAGPSRWPDAGAWSDWAPLAVDVRGAFTWDKPPGRFAQFRAELTTEDPANTPAIRSIRLAADGAPEAPAPAGQLSLLDYRNGLVVGSSLDFQYEPLPNGRLTGQESSGGLARQLRDARTQFERAVRILGWLEARGGRTLFIPSSSWAAWDILATRATAPTRPLPSQIVLLQSLQGRGGIGRIVAFAGPDRTHEVVEFWSDDYGKWVLLDGWAGEYFVDVATGQPLNALELHQRFVAAGLVWNSPGPVQGQAGSHAPARPTAAQLGLRVISPTGARAADHPLELWAAGAVLLIPRNNFVSARSPLPLNPGWTAPGWTGYVWAGVGARPGPQISQRVYRIRDFYWTVNQTALDIEYGDKPGEFKVYLHSNVPSFEARPFQADVDENGYKPVSSSFQWQLAPGPNCLQVRVRTKAGVLGPPSYVRVNFVPPAREPADKH